jgi:hypothetical protein
MIGHAALFAASLVAAAVAALGFPSPTAPDHPAAHAAQGRTANSRFSAVSCGAHSSRLALAKPR